MKPRLSIALAAHGGSRGLGDLLDRLGGQVTDGVEVLVCHPRGEQEAVEACRTRPWATPVEAASQCLVPHLWRDGILRASAPRVALTNIQCRPAPGWIEALLKADLERFAGVGGSIDNDPDSDALGWAVYLLRYLRYSSTGVAHETDDLPGDNAVYDRASLLEQAEAFEDGFFEPPVHARLIRGGRRLLWDPAIAVTYQNAYGLREFARLRFLHGRRYGRDRAAAMSGAKRALYLALSPAIPVVFGAKILRDAIRDRRALRALPRALPSLALLLGAWSAGEASGVLDALASRGSV